MQQPQETAIEWVRRFRELRVLLVGDAVLDTYLEGEAAQLSREGPVPVVYKTAEQRLPGGAANGAANLRALGAEVTFVSQVGGDHAGSLLRTALLSCGVSDQWLVEDEQATPHKLRILADGQYVVRFDEGGKPSPSSPDPRSREHLEHRLLSHLEEWYPHCDAVMISDYGYGVLSEKIIAALARLQQTHLKPLLIDAHDLLRFREIEATVVTPNLMEAQRVLDQERASLATSTHLPDASLGHHLLSVLKTQSVALTLAEQGVLLVDRLGLVTHLPAHPVEHAQDVGAGDSFASALVLALAAGGTREEAVRIGIDSAGIAVTKPRTAVVSYHELLQRVSVRVYSTQAQAAQGEETTLALERLIAQLNIERLMEHRLVVTNGVFDILHVGHIQLLRQAKALGDLLIVGVNGDQSTRRLKGPGRPLNSERDRIALVAALDMVDQVVLFESDTAAEVIRLLRPHIYVKGGDYTPETLPEAESEAIRDVGGQIVFLPLAGSGNTRRMIDRIASIRASGSEIQESSHSLLD